MNPEPQALRRKDQKAPQSPGLDILQDPNLENRPLVTSMTSHLLAQAATCQSNREEGDYAESASRYRETYP